MTSLDLLNGALVLVVGAIYWTCLSHARRAERRMDRDDVLDLAARTVAALTASADGDRLLALVDAHNAVLALKESNGNG